jgi:hypothetical protein
MNPRPGPLDPDSLLYHKNVFFITNNDNIVIYLQFSDTPICLENGRKAANRACPVELRQHGAHLAKSDLFHFLNREAMLDAIGPVGPIVDNRRYGIETK